MMKKLTLFFTSGVWCFSEVSSFANVAVLANQRIESLHPSLATQGFKQFPKKELGIRLTRLEMVFTAPDSLVEQISTKDFIDKILDDCFLTRAKQPIMVQFNPSSRYVSNIHLHNVLLI